MFQGCLLLMKYFGDKYCLFRVNPNCLKEDIFYLLDDLDESSRMEKSFFIQIYLVGVA